MDFTIKPFVGAGPITFGMSQQEVRKILNYPCESFKRTPSSSMPCDYFKDIGVFVYYKLPGIVEAIEFCEPADTVFGGLNLLKEPVSRIKAMLEGHENNLDDDCAGFTARSLGIGIYAPDADDDPMSNAESAIVFEKGYYD